MKLFVVGEASPNPANWSWDYTLVLASDEAEARQLANDDGLVCEVPTDKPLRLAHIAGDYGEGW